ncbi:hypothetical protein [Paenibacillus xylaniclasticus]|uniref:hypothetical protein n=1 Tax=Paenibacillus xylaniclasticus TaxID=588083 RepID=UPI000FD88CBA|nr:MULTISPECIES: hypothetical protein [Paenibacillus]GFN33237.1 hypothetical protein PCURB6_34970 [Paenibacillus curdlanolyticus]
MEMAMQSGKTMLKNKKGLTRIELLAIVVLIGLIAVIAIPAVNTTIAKSKTSADVVSEKIFKKAAIRYAMETDAQDMETVTANELIAAGYLTTELEWSKPANAKTTATFSISPTGVITVILS